MILVRNITWCHENNRTNLLYDLQIKIDVDIYTVVDCSEDKNEYPALNWTGALSIPL